MPTYKSKFEEKFAHTLSLAGLPVAYETTRLPYVKECTYSPDWEIAPNVFVETKGLFGSADRSKIERVLKAHPDITIIMCFQNPDLRLNKTSKTTYRKWCEKRGIPWCVDTVSSLKGVVRSVVRGL